MMAGNYPCCCGEASSGTDCALCTSGKAPTYFIVTVSGWADSGSYPSSCNGWCSTMNGTYVVDKNGRANCRWGECYDITDSPFVDNGFGANICDPLSGGLLSERFQSLKMEIGFDTTYNEIYLEMFGYTISDACVSSSYSSSYWYYTIPGSNPYDCETYLGTTFNLTRYSGSTFAALCNSATSVTMQGVY
jgi:hypothetical protein